MKLNKKRELGFTGNTLEDISEATKVTASLVGIDMEYSVHLKARYHLTKSMHKFGDPYCEKIVTTDRVPTGDKSVDELLYGGIPAGYAALLMSPLR
ncbi:MAG: hypothetical protein ACE5OY_04235 [Candidatus Bathyarchaeia archaeon]